MRQSAPWVKFRRYGKFNLQTEMRRPFRLIARRFPLFRQDLFCPLRLS